MKKMSIICLILASLLAGCTSYMYGVPQETWDRMSEPERIEAMRVYEREQQARRQAAEERARRKAVARERERARQAALERERRERIEAIYRGEGAYGELIRVRLQGGRIKIGDRHHRYEPLTFAIADGDTRKISIADRKGREASLIVTYGGGALSLDGLSFPYERRWGRGSVYADANTSGALQLQGVDVFIEVRDRPARFERDMPRLIILGEDPPMVLTEREHHRPPPVIIKEKDRPKPPPVVDRGKDNYTPPPVRQPVPPPPVRQPDAPPPVRQPDAPPSVRQPVPPPAERQIAQSVAERTPRSLEVALLSGELKVRGRKLQVEPSALRLAEGESRELPVKAGAETVMLSLHYLNGELLVEGTQQRGRNAVRLRFEKEWKGGKVYRFDVKGKVFLENVELKVTGIE